MKRWYCPRGARRGLILSALTVALWGCWALGYTQAFIQDVSHITYKSTLIPICADPTCCKHCPNK